MGGQKSKSDECWRDTRKDILDAEKVKIVAYMLESLINVVMSTHVYKFGGQYYLQSEGELKKKTEEEFCIHVKDFFRLARTHLVNLVQWYDHHIIVVSF